jgi:hypothetical protein
VSGGEIRLELLAESSPDRGETSSISVSRRSEQKIDMGIAELMVAYRQKTGYTSPF